MLGGAQAEKALMDEPARADRDGAPAERAALRLGRAGHVRAPLRGHPRRLHRHAPRRGLLPHPQRRGRRGPDQVLPDVPAPARAGRPALKDLVLSFKGIAAAGSPSASTISSPPRRRRADGPSGGRRRPSAAAGAPSAPLVTVAASLCTPNGTELVRELSMSLGRGEQLLVRGPNGAGSPRRPPARRDLAGRPAHRASAPTVRWAVPPAERMFLPQRPYVISRLTLLRTCSTPRCAAAARRGRRLSSGGPPPRGARAAHGAGRRRSTRRWVRGLSPGECPA